MEKAESWERKSVTNELNKGLELANKLKRQLHSSTHSREACEFLLKNIVCCYDNALSLLNCVDFLDNVLTEGVEVSDQDFKDHVFAAAHKKRRNLPIWSEEVRVCSGTGFEGQFDDGYNWRKYGQKYILGTTHPRSYYRCTHRNTQGCLATKQVQRGKDDPSIYKVAYRGCHTCVVNQTKENVNVETSNEDSQAVPHETMINNEPGLKTEPQEILNLENAETQFLSKPSSKFHFSMSPSHSNGHMRIDDNFVTPESYSADMIFDPISTANGDFDFLIDNQVDFSSCLVEAADYFSHPQGL